jgi:ABC-2 type transport system permease protein
MLAIVLLLPEPYRMGPPASPAAGLAFGVSMLGALFLGCAITNIVSISALWTVTRRLLPATVGFFSGMIVPLAFFPDWSQPALRLLPFSGLADIPFRFYLGTLPPHQLAAHVVLQLFWTIFFVLIGLWLLGAATRRVVVQGG